MPDLEHAETMLARWRKAAGADWPTVFRKRLDLLRETYQTTGRIHAPWEAVLRARALGEPPPPWVLDYLATVAASVHEIALAASAGEPVDPKALGRALGSVQQGAGTGFPSEKDWQWCVYALQVRDLLPDKTEHAAVRVVAEENRVSETTVRNAWKRLMASTKSG